MSKPFDIKITKHTQKGSIFKNYELMIAGMSFSILKNAGGSKNDAY